MFQLEASLMGKKRSICIRAGTIFRGLQNPHILLQSEKKIVPSFDS